MNPDSELRAFSRVDIDPPRWLAASTERRCRAAFQTPRPAARRVPRWEWLVYAASLAICGGHVAHMTWWHVNHSREHAALGRSR